MSMTFVEAIEAVQEMLGMETIEEKKRLLKSGKNQKSQIYLLVKQV